MLFPFTTEIELNMKTNADDQSRRWKAKHTYAYAFYNAVKPTIMSCWMEMSPIARLRPDVWMQFAKSEKLWGVVWKKFGRLPLATMHNCALGELPGDGGEAVTRNGGRYSLIFLEPGESFLFSPDVPIEQIFKNESARRFACRQLLKTVLLYLFADIHRGEFIVTFSFCGPLRVDRTNLQTALLAATKQDTRREAGTVAAIA